MSDNSEIVPIEPRDPLAPTYRSSAAVAIEPERSDGYAYLRAYWNVLRKRRGPVLTVLIVVTTLVTVISFKMEPVYRAVGRVEIETETPTIQSLSDFDRTLPTDELFVETQVKVIQSDQLAWRTIQQLRLGDNLAFSRNVHPPDRKSGDPRLALETNQIKAFDGDLTVNRVARSRLIEVSFESTDSQLAAQVVNNLINNYIEYNFRKKYDATRQVSGWMEQQLDELKAKVEESQQALVDYERQSSIVNVGDKQNVAEQRLADLTRDLTVAQSDRLEKESLYELVRTNENQAALLAQNQLLQRLEEKQADLKSGYVDALGQYGPNFPKVVRLRDQVNEMQSLIDRERKRVVSRICDDYTAAQGRQRLLEEAVTAEKAEVGKLNQLLIQHNILKREFETNQQLYESLLQRLKDATVSSGLRATNIHIVDPALPPSIPARPKKLLNIIVGLIAGLILGIALVFMQEELDTSVKSADDVERLTACPALAIIPEAPLNGTRPARSLKQNGSKPSPNGHVELAVLHQPTSLVAECYRSLRTAVLLSMAPRPPQVLLVTSPQPAEGKTCTALNLTFALAQRGARVLLVDADLRKPGIARPLGLTGDKGLSSVLTGTSSLDESLSQVEGLPNLSVLAAGPRPPNPADLLSSSCMEELLRRLRRRFDHVIVDSPPSLLVTDATILSTLVDATIMVAQLGITTRTALTRAHKTLESAGAKIMGVVLNRANSRNTDSYYYGSYDSGYYEHYEEDEVSALVPPSNGGGNNGAHPQI
ncbi:MAG: polysaccharide biosynthesis tyrosine autokinase [Acidobacteriia bacterium]|nr:polysaccharide biosynthesis tyrosine autokinase [Terriglobia bacterium]